MTKDENMTPEEKLQELENQQRAWRSKGGREAWKKAEAKGIGKAHIRNMVEAKRRKKAEREKQNQPT